MFDIDDVKRINGLWCNLSIEILENINQSRGIISDFVKKFESFLFLEIS